MALQAWWKINRWLIIGVLALAIAVYAGLRVLALRPQQAVTPQANVPVYVLTRPVTADTPLAADDIIERMYPTNLIPPGAFRGTVVGEWSTEALAPGEVLLASQVFVPTTSDVVANRIPRGEVAFDLSVPAQSAVDGILAPGDRITIFTTVAGTTGTTTAAGGTRVFLRHVDILAINGLLTGVPSPGASEQLILALPAVDAEALTYAEQHSTLTVVLERPHEHLGTVPIYGSGWPSAPTQK